MNQAANIMQSLRDLARLGEDLRKLAEGTPEYEEHEKKRNMTSVVELHDIP